MSKQSDKVLKARAKHQAVHAEWYELRVGSKAEKTYFDRLDNAERRHRKAEAVYREAVIRGFIPNELGYAV